MEIVREGVMDNPFTAPTAAWKAKYAPIIGIRVRSGRDVFALVSCNDLGVPYFSKVVHGRVQVKQYVLPLQNKAWALSRLGNN